MNLPNFLQETIVQVRETTSILSELYPEEANYGSRCSLWLRGLNDGLVSIELYDKANEVYGRMWNYVGD